jgi:two-component system, response regulator PdtaR
VAEREAFDRIGIVVVEDEALIRSELLEAFPKYGFYVLGAADAADALKILQDEAERIHAVFTDVHLPGPMSGLLLGRHIRKTWPWISLLVTSGYGTPDPSHMPEGGRFVLKPYRIGGVAEQVKEMVRARRLFGPGGRE